MREVDLNADLGEGYGAYACGDDAAMLGLVTSANVACGLHAGDPEIMAATFRLARERNVAVGMAGTSWLGREEGREGPADRVPALRRVNDGGRIASLRFARGWVAVRVSRGTRTTALRYREASPAVPMP